MSSRTFRKYSNVTIAVVLDTIPWNVGLLCGVPVVTCTVDKNQFKCVHCAGSYNAAYSGCIVYKVAGEVTTIASVQKFPFSTARRIA